QDFGGTVVNADGTLGPDGEVPEHGVASDSLGNMYGTATSGRPFLVELLSSLHAGMVWEITTSGVYKDLHDFGGSVTNADGTNGRDGNAPNCSIALDGAGNLYGTAAGGPSDLGAGMLWEIAASGCYSDLHDFGFIITNATGTTGSDGAG